MVICVVTLRSFCLSPWDVPRYDEVRMWDTRRIGCLAALKDWDVVAKSLVDTPADLTKITTVPEYRSVHRRVGGCAVRLCVLARIA